MPEENSENHIARTEFKNVLSAASSSITDSNNILNSATFVKFNGIYKENNEVKKATRSGNNPFVIDLGIVGETDQRTITIKNKRMISDKNILIKINENQQDNLDTIINDLEEIFGVYPEREEE